MADHPEHTKPSLEPIDAPSERAFVLFWMSYTMGLLALLMGISGVSLLMR